VRCNESGLRIDLLIALAAHAHLFAVIELLHFNPDRFNAFVAHQHDIGPIQRRFGFDDSALPTLSARFLVPLDDIDILYENAFLLAVHLKNLTDLAFIFTGSDLDFVVFFQFAGKSLHKA
jgi:hypothetical protein